VTALRAAGWTVLALGAWAVDFAVMYALVTFACPWPALGWIATAACAAGALTALRGALRAGPASGDSGEAIETSRLGRDVAVLTAALSLIAILWLGIAVLSPPTCGPAVRALMPVATETTTRTDLHRETPCATCSIHG
jgi:hypothetical protein